jgi:hypothetical protein
MANKIRIKRRANGGGAGAPASLENAELAFNEQTNILYYGTGTGGAGGTATSIITIAGNGAFVDLSSAQTVDGIKTFTDEIVADISGNAGTVTDGVYTTDTATVTNTMLVNDSVTVGTTEITLGSSETTIVGLVSVTSTDFVGDLTGTADTAVALETGRTISITGDIAYTSDAFDGTAAVTGTGTLSTVNLDVGTFTKVTVNGKGLVTAAVDASISDLTAPTGDVAWGTYKITGLGDPTSAQDAATKAYVDSVAQGLDPKASCVAATTANITLSGAQTIDGISITAGMRVLVKNQTLDENNGIYQCNAGAWNRTTDANTWDSLIGAFTFIEQGTTQADSGWVCSVNSGGTLGTTPVTWVQFSAAGSYTAGTGLTLTGNEFSITNTAVTAATYGTTDGFYTTTFTVNAQGQLTDAADYEINVDGGTF